MGDNEMKQDDQEVTITQLRDIIGAEYMINRPTYEKAFARIKKLSGIEMTRDQFERLKMGIRNVEALLNEGMVDRTKFKILKYKLNCWGKDGANFQTKVELEPLENVTNLALIKPYVPVEFPPMVTPGSSTMEQFLIPDIHFGYRMIGDWSDPEGVVLEPLHDEGAVEIYLRVAWMFQPAVINILGDVLDLPALSKFLSAPSLKHLVQPAVDAAGKFLERLRAVCPNSRIIFVKGNHEERIDKQLKFMLPELFGLCKAGEKKPLFAIPSLLHFDKLNIEYSAPYGKRIFVNNVMVSHGELVGKRGGDSVSKALAAYRCCCAFGHVHRLELAFETLWLEEGPVDIWAMSCGTGARTDGTLPGPMYPNWQKGFGTVWSGNHPELHVIRKDYKVTVAGKVIGLYE